MEQNPLCIAFASQKGGVGKSTLTVLAASWLHYLHGIRVAVVDCDYPQHSILKLSNRDKAVVQSSAIYGRLLVSLAENKGVKPYRILCCKPSEAMSEWRKWAAVAEERYDVVLFDLPGTVGNEGVLSTIVELDYLFIPMKADRIVLESTLNFASVLNDRLIKTGRAHLRELFLFWNLVDRRERTPLSMNSTRKSSISWGCGICARIFPCGATSTRIFRKQAARCTGVRCCRPTGLSSPSAVSTA